MNNSARKVGAALGLAAIASFSVAFPATAAVTASEWGVFGDSENGFDGALYFDNANFPDAEIMISDEASFDYLTPEDEDEGFSAGDPLGDLIGANFESPDTLFYKVTTAADDAQATYVEITFDDAVPAGQLVVAISDIDSDQAVISMTDGESADLSASEIIGTATSTGFNWEDTSNTTDIPVVEEDDATAVIMHNAPDGTDGSTGWVRPSAEVKGIEIWVNTTDGNQSSQRIWIGQVIETADGLADTGASDSLFLVAIAGGTVLAAGGALTLRRRRA